MSAQTELDIHGYVAKLHHDSGHPNPEKMIDTLMREGCSDYSLEVAKQYLTFKESVVYNLFSNLDVSGARNKTIKKQRPMHRHGPRHQYQRKKWKKPERSIRWEDTRSIGEPTAVYHIT